MIAAMRHRPTWRQASGILTERRAAAVKKPSLRELRAISRVSLPAMLVVAIGLAITAHFVPNGKPGRRARCRSRAGDVRRVRVICSVARCPTSEVAEWIAKHPPHQIAAA